MRLRSVVARNTLNLANEARDWRIYPDFAQGLIATARSLYAVYPQGFDISLSLRGCVCGTGQGEAGPDLANSHIDLRIPGKLSSFSP